MRQKIFDTKSWHNPLKHKFFRYPKLMKDWRNPLRHFSALWDKKFSTENFVTPPLLIHKLFRYQKFSEKEHRRVPLRNFSALWDKKFSTILWYCLPPPPPPPPFLSINFFVTRYFVKHKRVPLRSFSALSDKTIFTENCDTRPLSYP